MGVYRRGNTYWIDFYSGTRRVRERVGTKEEARVTLGKRLEDIRMGRNPELRRIRPKRLWGMVKQFLKRHAALSRNPQTFRVRARPVLRHFKGMTLQEITPGHIQDYIAARLREGVSKATTNRERAFLSALYACASRWGYFGGDNPVKAVKAFPESPGNERALTESEAKRLIDAAAKHLKPVILLALHTGARIGETLKLRWADIDLGAGMITFIQSNTKSGRGRSVPLDDVLIDMLKERRKVRSIREDDPEGYVFTWQGKPMKRVATAFKRARINAGLDDAVTPHTLRHSFAAGFVSRGGDVFRLQRFLGHSTIGLTQRYGRHSAEYLQDARRYFGPVPDPIGHESVTTDREMAPGESSEMQNQAGNGAAGRN